MLKYVLEIEEQIRASRSDGMPWGQALLHALEEESDVWADANDLLSASRTGPMSSRTTDVPKIAPMPGADVTAVKVKPATGTSLPSGVQICKRWNDARGCPGRKRSQGKAHVCDVLLASGSICASPSRRRA